MGKPVISVVTICYNSVRTIEETLQSVISQKYPYLDYVIIDGGSTDGTLDVVERYQNIWDISIPNRTKASVMLSIGDSAC